MGGSFSNTPYAEQSNRSATPPLSRWCKNLRRDIHDPLSRDGGRPRWVHRLSFCVGLSSTGPLHLQSDAVR
jgi:hypothetical protein